MQHLPRFVRTLPLLLLALLGVTAALQIGCTGSDTDTSEDDLRCGYGYGYGYGYGGCGQHAPDRPTTD